MVLLTARTIDMDEAMPQTVPSAGFTPPCDYSNFAENFDLSLLPDCDPVSPSTLFYSQIDQNNIKGQPRIYTTFYPCSPEQQLADNDLTPDFQTLLVPEENKSKYSAVSNIYLEVPNSHIYPPNSPASSLSPYSPHSQGLLSPNDQFNNYRQSLEGNFYPSSPEQSLYTSPSPSSVYSKSPCDDFLNSQFNIKKEQYSSNNSPLPSFSPFRIKEENFLSPCGFSSPTSPAASYSSLSSSDQINYHHTEKTDVLDLLENTVLDKQIKQENGSTVDFSKILQFNQDTLRELLQQDLKKSESQIVPEKPKDHQLLREVLRDTSYQKKYNIRPFDLGFISGDTTDIKMEEPDKAGDLIDGCDEQIARENIEPVLNLAIEQMRKEVDSTCTSLGISPDPSKWNPANVLSWVRWTSRQFNLPEPQAEQWDLTGATLLTLSEEDFSNRASESGMFLHAQLEIWKAYSEEDLGMQWLPVENTSSNASSGDFSEDDEEETSSQPDPVKPTSSRSGSSHIHLWQFLKELLASPQTHGSCIRWLDRSKGIFKIEDSVKVARLWGKRKNRPAMNYDKLSRSIRQYYKKGIMKKTERSQRLVYQFCHPYNL